MLSSSTHAHSLGKALHAPGSASDIVSFVLAGIDIDSTKDVVVRNTMVDSNDDMLCMKSGAGWLGRHAGVPSENIIFEDCEIRSGHGLTLGSEMSGGVRNVTYRNIFYNASASCVNADPRNCGGAKPHSNPGGAHFKTQRGRGGYLTDIMVSVVAVLNLCDTMCGGHCCCCAVAVRQYPRLRSLVGDLIFLPSRWRAADKRHSHTSAT